ncbi:LysR family transcriptional regulator substrate-binding protein, partial [Eggerthella sinensis]|uniref:LysR family transcriptional regulator substrate-binding protein n=1 Tax=Eggerthella sinensis TaxID=242230 RepID=UPI00266D1A2B
VVLPPDHPLADAPFVPREALAEGPYIRLKSGTSSEMETLFRNNEVEPDVRFTIDSDYAVMSMVSAGLGFSVLPDLILRDAPFPLAIKQPEVETSREIAIALRSMETASVATRAFLDVAQQWIADTYGDEAAEDGGR